MAMFRAFGGQGSLGLRVYKTLRAEASMESEALRMNQNLVHTISKLREASQTINELVVLPSEPQVSELTDLLAVLETPVQPKEANNATSHHSSKKHHAAAKNNNITSTSHTPQSAPHGKLSANTSKTLIEQRDTLKSLFAHLKADITRFNKEQAETKAGHDKVLKELNARLDHDRAQLNQSKPGTFEYDRLTNLTRAEVGEISYWRHGRQLQQSMFHANLKITHGLMSRSKAVMEAYTQALNTGHLDTATRDALRSAMTSLPKALIVTKRVIKREGLSLKRHLAARLHLGLPP